MNITSTAFSNEGTVPKKYTCDGEDVNPPLEFSDIPAGTKSLALIVDDPDAPAGTWVHWTLWNIKPETKEILENTVPESSTEGTTSFGKPGYGGPCPPSGVHRYYFKLYALDTVLNLGADAKVSELEKAASGHILGQATIMGKYSRS